jgi:hypothetical protein
MRLNVSPVVPYVVGAMLVFFGALRAKYLGAPRVPRLGPGEDDKGEEVQPVRGKEQKRHRAMGAVWVVLGLFLIVSTYIQVRRR